MSKQIYTNITKLIRIDAGWHKILSIKSARAGKSIKRWLEDYLSESGVTENNND